MSGRLRANLANLIRSESGIALPMAILATVIGLALAAIPVMASMDTQGADRHNQSSNAAYTAADSGVELAIQRQTLMGSKVTTSLPCVKKNGTKLEAVAKEASGWCPRVPTTGTESVGSGGFSYRVKPVSTSSISVVSTGSSSAGGGTVNSRVMANATSSGTKTTPAVFGAEGVVGIEWIKMTGSASIYGNAGSNGYIDWTGGNPSMPGCTQMRGEFRKLEWQTTPCPAVRETRTYPNVVVPTENSNGRMFTAGGDTYTSSNGALGSCGSGKKESYWCPETKVLKLASDTTVTLGGEAPYVLCQLLVIGNSQLIMAAGSHIRIIFESPENCGLASGSPQMQIENSGRIISKSFSPTTGNYSVPGFYFVGSSTRTTTIILNGAATGNNMIIYAPRSEIKIEGGASFGGAILGKTVLLEGGTRAQPEGTGSFKPDENLPVEQTETGGGNYTQGAYVECSSTLNETEPGSGC